MTSVAGCRIARAVVALPRSVVAVAEVVSVVAVVVVVVAVVVVVQWLSVVVVECLVAYLLGRILEQRPATDSVPCG